MMQSPESRHQHSNNQRQWDRHSLIGTDSCRGGNEIASNTEASGNSRMIHSDDPQHKHIGHETGEAQVGSEHSQRRTIQVAVRCRPRRSRRGSSAIGIDGESEDTDQDEVDDIGHDASHTSPTDSVIQYDGDDAAGRSEKGFSALLIPSHVLALGGHGPMRRFEFDFVFPPSTQQQDVYKACVFNAIQGVLDSMERCESSEGAHATIVAYGQTGTGKTYTMGMLRCTDAQSLCKDHGIIPRAIVHILSRIHAFNSSNENRRLGVRLVIRMSFLQIYLETVQDLLVGEKKGTTKNTSASVPDTDLQVRLNPVTRVFYVEGLSEFEIEHVDDARMLLERAARRRVLGATARNKTSSRSHTLLTLTIARDRGVNHPAPISTVSFVDLAGSEKVEGALHFLHATRKRQELRVREAKFINRSLSALGSVIAALSVSDDQRHDKKTQRGPVVNLYGRKAMGMSPKKPPAQHIRFRDSQLTKLLQSRLVSGNGRLVLIATIDDRPTNLTETLSTLKFASQCRKVDVNQSSLIKAEVARRRREQSLLQQVFADVKVMYEEREKELKREHTSTVLSLEARIQDLEKRLEEASCLNELPGQQQALRAAYVALCSLADLSQAPESPMKVSNLPINELGDKSIGHIAQLYQQVKGKLAPIPAAARGKVRRYSTETTVEHVSSDVDSSDGLSPTQMHPVVASRPDEATHTRVDSKGSGADDIEFLAIARHLYASGQLQFVEVSSDEEESGPHSQL